MTEYTRGQTPDVIRGGHHAWGLTPGVIGGVR
jgi:hypothetical protein